MFYIKDLGYELITQCDVLTIWKKDNIIYFDILAIPSQTHGNKYQYYTLFDVNDTDAIQYLLGNIPCGDLIKKSNNIYLVCRNDGYDLEYMFRYDQILEVKYTDYACQQTVDIYLDYVDLEIDTINDIKKLYPNYETLKLFC